MQLAVMDGQRTSAGSSITSILSSLTSRASYSRLCAPNTSTPAQKRKYSEIQILINPSDNFSLLIQPYFNNYFHQRENESRIRHRDARTTDGGRTWHSQLSFSINPTDGDGDVGATLFYQNILKL